MTEVERAILRNQVALMRAKYTTEGDMPAAAAEAIRRRLKATEVMLFDPSTECQCPRLVRLPTRFLDTSHGAKMVCDLCDRQVRV